MGIVKQSQENWFAKLGQAMMPFTVQIEHDQRLRRLSHLSLMLLGGLIVTFATATALIFRPERN
ncbi:hypothetical protein FC62_GL001383 [Amylolactobacillus amylotrophicus DSM 20534]|uniref:Uncharacterized protein n=2 Tax=Amylolactobacillus TaxID=2767876 RepID=A0A0R1YQY1_9LACO|nr:hypothetical protein FC62_GL001383 [Amylolactobacillus amylotrophicus DSM 20534]KRM41667.1 hypothetical protein FD40_GL001229 [Amylolactobacillus amylophilus DSM 20533 = JCM 1125]